jgi:outer membrane protein insertion porin family
MIDRRCRSAVAAIALAGIVLLAHGTARAEEEAAADESPPAPASTMGSPSPAARTLSAVVLEGTLVDDKQRLLRFLGLKPGMALDEHLQRRVRELLETRLAYRILDEQLGADGKYTLRIEPVTVVRNVVVHGNLPLFEDEILRHLRVRSGSELPPGDRAEFLRKEAERLEHFLARDGYFDAKVNIVEEKTDRRDWVNLIVKIDLGSYYRLGELQVDGGKAVSHRELFRLFDRCCWFFGRFRQQDLRDDARRAEELLHERGYPAARVTSQFDPARDVDRARRRVKLPIKIVERRKVEAAFVGNRAISDRDLREQLTIFSSGAYDDIELNESARAVQRAYQQRGFFEAKVTWTKRRVSDAVDQVSFLIVEGPELRVRDVEVVGEGGKPLTFSSEDIKQRAGLETKVFPRLGTIGLGQGGYATTGQLKQDAERIVELYRSEGFPEAKVRPEVARDPAAFAALGAIGAEAAGAIENKNDLYVRFTVDEGRREHVSAINIVWNGPHGKSDADIRRVLKMTEGKPYSPTALLADQQRIGALYRGSPHPYLEVKYEPTWDATHEHVSLRMTITEGPRATFGEIIVRGNFKTRTRTILQDLPWKPGDPFDVAKLEEGERNLQTHGIFTAARVTALHDPVTMRTDIPVVVQVQERYFGWVSPILSFGIYSDRIPYYVVFAGGLQFNNFFGFGSQLELRVDYSPAPSYDQTTLGASLRYTDLRAFGPKWRLDLTFFYRHELTVRFGPVESIFGSVGLTRLLTSALRLVMRFDVYRASVSVPFIRTPGFETREASDNTVIAKLISGLIWDRRVAFDGTPNPLAPDRGWLLQAGLAYAPAPVNNQFVVLSGQALGILPIPVRKSRLWLVGNLRVDYGIPIGQPALPIVERFFAGGDGQTRGYAQDQLKTELVRTDISPLGDSVGLRVVPQGGNMRILTTVEFVFPIAKTFFGLPLQWSGAVFWDMGAIANSPDLLQGSDFKHSIGISLLRLITPFGPLSVEYAYPLSQSVAEERWKIDAPYYRFPGRLHFSLGFPIQRL